MAAVCMGGELAAHQHLRSGNMAIMKVRTSRDPVLMHLVRCLHFFCAQHDNRISATHIAGAANGPADALTCLFSKGIARRLVVADWL